MERCDLYVNSVLLLYLVVGRARVMAIQIQVIYKGVAMIFCWGGPDFKPQTNDR
jgi:hypothetical protein